MLVAPAEKVALEETEIGLKFDVDARQGLSLYVLRD